METKVTVDKLEIESIVDNIVRLPRVQNTGSDYKDLETICADVVFDKAVCWHGRIDDDMESAVSDLAASVQPDKVRFAVLNILVPEPFGDIRQLDRLRPVYELYRQSGRIGRLHYVNVDKRLEQNEIGIRILLA